MLKIKDATFKRLVKNSGFLLAGNVGASVINLISFSLTAKAIGAEQFGFFVLVQSYILIFDGLFNFQSWEALVKYGAIALEDKNHFFFSSIVKFGALLDLISAIVAFSAALIASRYVVSFLGWNLNLVEYIKIFGITILFNLSGAPIGVIRLFDDFKFLAQNQLVVSFLKLFLVIFGFLKHAQLIFFIVVFALTNIITNVLLIYYAINLMKRNIGSKWWKVSIYDYKEQLKFSIWSNLKTAIAIPVRRLDMVIIGTVLNAESVGVYKVYKEFALIFNKIAGPVNQAIYPEYARKIGAELSNSAIHLARKTIMTLGFIAIIFASILAIGSPLIVKYFFGQEFARSLDVLLILIFLYAISFTISPVNALFTAAGFVRYNVLIVIFTNIIYIFIAYYLTNTLQLYGIVIAFGTQMLINQSLKVVLLNKFQQGWSSVIR